MMSRSGPFRPGAVGGCVLRLLPRSRGDRRWIRPAACVLGCLVLLLAIFGSTAVSEARFVRGSGNPGNVFTAGTLKLVNSVDGGYVINVTGLRPDQSATGTFTLTCQGSFKGAVSITNGGITDTPSSPALSAALTLKIEDITGSAQTLWSGTMNSFTSLALTQFNSGETRTLRFTVTFPQAGAVPGLQGATSALLVKFVGVAQ
jgi:spore coat-associated protein N